MLMVTYDGELHVKVTQSLSRKVLVRLYAAIRDSQRRDGINDDELPQVNELRAGPCND